MKRMSDVFNLPYRNLNNANGKRFKDGVTLEQVNECKEMAINMHDDMYEMLERVLYNFEDGNSDHFEINDLMIPEIKALLAKARGEA